MAANPRSKTSVMNALPSLKKRPPTAGKMAKARGEECQCEAFSSGVFLRSTAKLGNIKSLADEWTDCLVSLAYESTDDRRLGIDVVDNLGPSLPCRAFSRNKLPIIGGAIPVEAINSQLNIFLTRDVRDIHVRQVHVINCLSCSILTNGRIIKINKCRTIPMNQKMSTPHAAPHFD